MQMKHNTHAHAHAHAHTHTHTHTHKHKYARNIPQLFCTDQSRSFDCLGPDCGNTVSTDAAPVQRGEKRTQTNSRFHRLTPKLIAGNRLQRKRPSHSTREHAAHRRAVLVRFSHWSQKGFFSGDSSCRKTTVNLNVATLWHWGAF